MGLWFCKTAQLLCNFSKCKYLYHTTKPAEGFIHIILFKVFLSNAKIKYYSISLIDFKKYWVENLTLCDHFFICIISTSTILWQNDFLTQMHMLFPPMLCLHVLSCSPVVFFPQWYSTDSKTACDPPLGSVSPSPSFCPWSIGHGWAPTASGFRYEPVQHISSFGVAAFHALLSFGDKRFKPAIEMLWWCEQRSSSAWTDSD